MPERLRKSEQGWKEQVSCLLDVVGSDDTMLSDMADREERVRIRELVDSCLTERETEIIRRRYGLDGNLPQTQRQVAAVFGISRSYVSRIEKRALHKLEEALTEGSNNL